MQYGVDGHLYFFIAWIHEEHASLERAHEFWLEEQPVLLLGPRFVDFLDALLGLLDPFGQLRAFGDLGLFLLGRPVVLDLIFFRRG